MTDASHRNALVAGYRLHWYAIDRVLGQGGFGVTYLAHDTNLGQRVAIKEYLPLGFAVRELDDSVHPVSGAHGDDFRWGLDRFVSEARTLARFDHPAIVRVLAVFEENNTAYMVMRYEEGTTLQERLRGRATLAEDALARLLAPLLDGLEAVHDAGFIHRDVKPGNVFVRAGGSPVLIDFGSARQALGAETRTLTSLISPGYAPFEQYQSRSGEQGAWTDVYGLAATLYRAIAGTAPADAVERGKALLGDDGDPLLPAVEIGRGRYRARFLEAVDRGLAFRWQDRPRDVREWRRHFDDGGAVRVAVSDGGAPFDPGAGDPDEVETALAPGRPEPATEGDAEVPSTLPLAAAGAEPALPAPGETRSPGAGPAGSAARPRRWPWLALAGSVLIAAAVAALLGIRAGRQAGPPASPAADDRGQASVRSAPDAEAPPAPAPPAPAPSEPAPEPTPAERVERLLAAARDAAAAGNEVRPAGASAFDHYAKALEIDPHDERARRGVRTIIERQVRAAVAAQQEGDFARAEALLDRLIEIVPGSDKLRSARERLRARRERLQSGRD